MSRRIKLHHVGAFAALVLLSLSPWAVAEAVPAVLTPPAASAGFNGQALSAASAEALLRAELAQVFPVARREAGGFHAPAGPRSDDPIFSVQQFRLTWLAAEVSRRRPDLRDTYADHAAHGTALLARGLWDDTYGGWFWELAPDGTLPVTPGSAEKHLYGQVFGIYASANAYRATGDAAAVRLALDALRWIDAHGLDREHGGYFEVFERDGDAILTAANSTWAQSTRRDRDHIGTPFGHKSMNAHIHALEALTVLYEAWPDEPIRRRLVELLEVVRDRIVLADGGMGQVFEADWTVVPGPRSYGHEVETAYLLIEAARALDGVVDARTWAVAKRLVDDALDEALEPSTGALLENPDAEHLERPWWAQVEMLNALVLMDAAYGGDEPRYRVAAERLWGYITTELVDDAGRWVTAADASGSWSGRRWYAAYHTGRSMLEVSDRLRGTASAEPVRAQESVDAAP